MDGIEQILDAAFVLAELHGDAVGVLFDAREMRQGADLRDEAGRRIGELDVDGAAQAEGALDILQ